MEEETKVEEKPSIEEEVEETPVEEVAEEATEGEEEEVVAEEVVEEHASGDEGKWEDVFTRLDALETKIGELITQGGANSMESSEPEEETELSDIEEENQKWYQRNAQKLNNY